MTAQPAVVDAYLEIAKSLFDGRLAEDTLPKAATSLPPLNQPLLDQLAAQAEEAGLAQPRHGWAMTAVADAAAEVTDDPFLKALAAWYLARAANVWCRLDRVQTAVTRARTGFTALGEAGWL